MSHYIELGSYHHPMSQPQYEAPYVVQDLPDRYIKIRVLEDYINARIKEFGDRWELYSVRDHHRVTLKRYLREDEIDYLQRKSYPRYFQSNDPFDV